ncbi:MAG: 2,4-dihydroxyhept-2-ene-1,7-dioic acid aldolase [Candidatus Hadarchaeum yellowstonense]|uniref:2,4-dihydroxyhept-2-ene-1,7-dioic acid aldolase n=1 Tax=Hadarchaeum yellowstonense TaxID=1776334 RepID=A0A147JYE2_HADYE|nr:MAG: 2,4-dihydroxyhept-2-ene-1,7-dioic acid aldolase [Candidatus Hadarchaeum yellowstonense]
MTGQFSLKEKLKTQTLTIGSWITLSHPAIAEIMAKAGFDWLTVDMEHSAITLHQAQQLVQVIELSGCTPLIRVGENNPNLIKRAMDTGAHGVIVPSVDCREDALKAVRAVKYPPLGTRGVGLARAQGYGMEFEKYKEWLNKESVVIVQIESIRAVKNLEKILRVKGVDAFMVGPYDLSGSLGRPGDFDHPSVVAALKQVMEISKKLKVPAGFHVIPPDVDALVTRAEEGYKFLAFSLDTLFLGQSCRKAVDLAKRRLSP